MKHKGPHGEFTISQMYTHLPHLTSNPLYVGYSNSTTGRRKSVGFNGQAPPIKSSFVANPLYVPSTIINTTIPYSNQFHTDKLLKKWRNIATNYISNIHRTNSTHIPKIAEILKKIPNMPQFAGTNGAKYNYNEIIKFAESTGLSTDHARNLAIQIRNVGVSSLYEAASKNVRNHNGTIRSRMTTQNNIVHETGTKQFIQGVQGVEGVEYESSSPISSQSSNPKSSQSPNLKSSQSSSSLYALPNNNKSGVHTANTFAEFARNIK